jgi:osmoprotectant transport system permease protein
MRNLIARCEANFFAASVYLVACLFFLLIGGVSYAAAPSVLKVGSKRFTESYVLGEVITRTIPTTAATAQHLQGLGNTAIVLNALSTASIDIYPEYTGTIAREILKLESVPSLAVLNEKLAPLGLAAAVPLGFNNTYALALPAAIARERGITRLSDLKAHPSLRLGLSQEFIGRADGWAGLKKKYALPWDAPRGLDHGLAYEAVAQGQVDVIDIYSTDAQIGKYAMVVLIDDAQYFPRYDAVLLYRQDVPLRFPSAWAAISQLEGRITDSTMQAMNAAAELDKQPFADVAARFLASVNLVPAIATTPALPQTSIQAAGSLNQASFFQKLFAPDFKRLLFEHLGLVFLSLLASIIVAIPLGIIAARHKRFGGVILGLVGILQTIPSLALLAVLIPLTGNIGFLPAFIALTIYALLPIVRNTHAGLMQVPNGIKQAARSLGMRNSMVLHFIELPLARVTILAGIKTSAVIGVGTATIAAFIGAGGFGERIVTGLALNDHATLLAGAIPVAALAICIEATFSLVERLITPAALRGATT